MIKRITLLRRREDLGVTAFRDHWSVPHARIARGFEDMRRYNQNRVNSTVWSFGPERFQIDGLVELWFGSSEAMARNGASATTQALIEDEPRFLSGLTSLIVGETWVSGSTEPKFKYMLPVITRDVAALEAAFGALMAGLDADAAPDEVAFDPTTPGFTRDRLWCEPVPPNAVISIWARDAANAAALVTGKDALLRRLLTEHAQSATAYEVDELRIV